MRSSRSAWTLLGLLVLLLAGCSAQTPVEPGDDTGDARESRLVDASDQEADDAHTMHDDVFDDEPEDVEDVSGGQWESGIGNGLDYASIGEAWNNRIEISCALRGDAPTQARFHVQGQMAREFVELTYDNGLTRQLTLDDYGVLATDCGSCAAYFEELLIDLRSHRRVSMRASDGRVGEVTLYRAGDAIPGQCRPNISFMP